VNFFFTTNTALHLIEDPELKACFKCLGVDLFGRKKLSGPSLEEKYTKVIAGGQGSAAV
jgi:hypothetical protein